MKVCVYPGPDKEVTYIVQAGENTTEAEIQEIQQALQVYSNGLGILFKPLSSWTKTVTKSHMK